MCFRADLFRCRYEISERQRGGPEQPRGGAGGGGGEEVPREEQSRVGGGSAARAVEWRNAAVPGRGADGSGRGAPGCAGLSAAGPGLRRCKRCRTALAFVRPDSVRRDISLSLILHEISVGEDGFCEFASCFLLFILNYCFRGGKKGFDKSCTVK